MGNSRGCLATRPPANMDGARPGPGQVEKAPRGVPRTCSASSQQAPGPGHSNAWSRISSEGLCGPLGGCPGECRELARVEWAGRPLPGAQLASGLGGEGGLGEDPNPPSSQILLFGK
jgi:hypothetical protein